MWLRSEIFKDKELQSTAACVDHRQGRRSYLSRVVKKTYELMISILSITPLNHLKSCAFLSNGNK
jgi:hypothetical protein